jgi:hypothetical protein
MGDRGIRGGIAGMQSAPRSSTDGSSAITDPTEVRFEVEDSDCGDGIALGPPDPGGGGGMGVNLVRAMSEEWGVEPIQDGTRVWAQLARGVTTLPRSAVIGAAR